MIAMCHTRVMRHPLIFLVCAAVLIPGGFAQAPGTLDPAKAPGAKQDSA